MTTVHRTQVLQLGEKEHAGTCSCGWKGTKRSTAIEARIDANRHFYGYPVAAEKEGK